MKRRIKQRIAVLLVMLLCMSCLPYTGSATEVKGAAESPVLAEEQASNPLDSATPISIGNTYNGAITEQNTEHYYQFTLTESGKVKLKTSDHIPGINYVIYDSNGDKAWNGYYEWNSTTNLTTVDEEIDLTSGAYYLAVLERANNQSYEYYGNYSFQLTFESAGESFQESGYGTNNTLDTASLIQVNNSYQGQIAWNDDKDFYRFSLPSSGRINLKTSDNIKGINYVLYDAEGEKLWGEYYEWNNITNLVTVDENIDLTAGTYYLTVLERGNNYYYEYYGNYSFQLNFTSSGESFAETNGGVDNALANANVINTDEIYNGQLALNDSKDFYRIDFSDGGYFNLVATANMKYINYILYDADGNELWSKTPYWNDVTQKIEINEELEYLTAGTYYLAATTHSGYTGNYSFQLTSYLFTPLVKTISNTSQGIKLSWYEESGVSGYHIYRRTGSGGWEHVHTTAATSWLDTGAQTNGKQYTYKVLSYKGNSVSGGYEKSMYRLSAAKISKAKALKGGKLSVKWKKNTKASGYQIKCVAGSKKITKTVSGKNISKATLSGLKKGKKYKVYVRSYKTVSGVKYYSAWSSAKTVKGKR